MTSVDTQLLDDVQPYLRKAETFRRLRTPVEVADAERALHDVETLLVQRIVSEAMLARERDDVLDGELTQNIVVLPALYRTVLGGPLLDLIDAFDAVAARRVRSPTGGEFVSLYGYASHVDAVTLYAESLVEQVLVELNYWWVHHPMQGKVTLREAYRYKREFVFTWFRRRYRSVRTLRHSVGGRLTQQALAQRFVHVQEQEVRFYAS